MIDGFVSITTSPTFAILLRLIIIIIIIIGISSNSSSSSSKGDLNVTIFMVSKK